MTTRGFLRAVLFCMCATVIFLTAACPSRTDETLEVAGVLDERDHAISAGSVERYVATLSEDYLQDPCSPHTETERLGRYFATWPVMEAGSTNRYINVDGDTAFVMQRLDLAGYKDDKPQLRFTGPEELKLAHRGGRWQVQRARTDLDPILFLLETRRRAMMAGDLELYLSTIASDYDDGKGKDFATLKQSMQKQFDAWDSIEIDVLERSISVGDNSAEAIQSFRMNVAKAEDSQTFSSKERILFEHIESGAWRIVGGL